MHKNYLQEKISLGHSQRKIAEEFGCSQSTVKYWLAVYGLKTKLNVKNTKEIYLCSSCGELDVNKFKNCGKGKKSKSICSSCHNKRRAEQFRELKLWAVEKLGGKCVICGYNKCLGSLHFHHRNPEEKSLDYDRLRKMKKNGSLEKELEKCDLVCANCHGEIHWGRGEMGSRFVRNE